MKDRKNEILVIYGKEYGKMTRRLLEEADLAAQIGDRKKRIGIKPNLVSPVLPSDGATTHPEVVESLICYLKDHGFENLVIMEGSWVGARTEEAFKVCGYRKLADKYGIELRDGQKERSVPVDCKGMKIDVCACALEVDFLINVPVMKGHCQTRVTCALKNMKGLLPNKEKRRFHSMGLHKPIGHLAAGIRQDFILVDSICGDLSFEDGGNPTSMDRIFAAWDPVLCDAYVCRLLAYRTEEVPYIGIAESLGAGSTDLNHAVIRELNLSESQARLPDRDKVMRLSEAVNEVDSCSACYGYLIPALDRLDQEGLLKDFPEKICIGQGYKGMTGTLGIGSCTKNFTHSLKGCPPTETQIYDFLKEYLAGTGRLEAGRH